ncbi:MAG: hypothetical protein ACTSSN_11200 [Candidatus Heimdallarchaeaceae archaeon]
MRALFLGYVIDGAAAAIDLYPLNYIPEVSEFSSISLAFIMILAFLAIPVIILVYKKKK